MAIWEYKIITSGKGGFASPQLLEQHLNQLGKEEWEIVEFHTAPDNPLAFNGLVRRAITRDWFPKPEETKPAYVPPPIPKAAAEEPEDTRDERSFADELPPQRPANVPPPADLGLGDFDEIDDGGEEDLPTLFDALRPFLRKNQRGDQSVGVEFLAKKFEQNERELLGAFAECGLEVPTGPAQKAAVVEHAGALYWLETDKKGNFWLNTREKRFKVVKTTPVPVEPAEAQAPAAVAPQPETDEPVATVSAERQAAPANEPVQTRSESFLGRLCGMMRRNRHGGGWSGSFAYLTKALKLENDRLLATLVEQGLRLPEPGQEKPTFVEDGGLSFWLNKNQRGEIWINARRARNDAGHAQPASAEPAAAADAAAAPQPPVATEPAAATEPPAPAAEPSAAPPPENALAAVRPLLQPKKRGGGVAALVGDVAQQLGRSQEELLQALAAAGLDVPADARAKASSAQHGGEIFWMNRNSRDQLWLNAKQAPQRKARSKKPGDGPGAE